MIKSSTVIKRMIAKNWRPFLTAVLAVTALTFLSQFIESTTGINSMTAYWSMCFALFIGFVVKWSYDWHKMELQHEQERMMRDLGKENDKN